MSIGSPWIAAACAAVLVLGGAAVAVAKPVWEMTFTIGASPSSLGRGMRWTRKPTNSEVFALFPRAAFEEKVSGVTLLECVATIEGRLADCTVMEEKPEGKGFAEASQAVLKLYEFGPRERITAEMAGQKVKVPFIWGLRRNSSRETRP